MHDTYTYMNRNTRRRTSKPWWLWEDRAEDDHKDQLLKDVLQATPLSEEDESF